MTEKAHPTIGCCDIDCGLCPRLYTRGPSRCPGCGGEGFSEKHPACGFHSCCFKKRGFEVCAQCPDYPCSRFGRETGERDSFVLHRRVRANQALIKEQGLTAFLTQQERRMVFLQEALANFDDGRCTSYFCIAAALLTPASLEAALQRARAGKDIKVLLQECADKQGQELKLRK